MSLGDIVLDITEDEARLLYRLVSEKFIQPHSNIDIDYSLIILMNKLSKVLKMDEEFKTVWAAPGFEDNAKVTQGGSQ
jgi:hypothetical protein